jgi:hypothetical protein
VVSGFEEIDAISAAWRAFALMRGIMAMPREGTLSLSDVRAPALAIVRGPRGQRGHSRVEELMAQDGCAKLTDLLARGSLESQLVG